MKRIALSAAALVVFSLIGGLSWYRYDALIVPAPYILLELQRGEYDVTLTEAGFFSEVLVYRKGIVTPIFQQLQLPHQTGTPFLVSKTTIRIRGDKWIVEAHFEKREESLLGLGMALGLFGGGFAAFALFMEISSYRRERRITPEPT